MQKKILWPLLISLLAGTVCFGQGIGFLSSRQLSNPPAPKLTNVKAIKLYSSNQLLGKKQPFVLEQVLEYDTGQKLTGNTTYTYSQSIFGKDTSSIKMEYAYFEGTDQIKTFSRIFRTKELSKLSVYGNGTEFNPDGETVRYFIYRPSGIVDTISIGEQVEDMGHEVQVRKAPALDGLSPRNAALDSTASRTRGRSRAREWNPPQRKELPKNKVVYEALLDGYVLKEISPEGEVVQEQRVRLNKDYKPIQVVIHNGRRSYSIFNFLYDEAGNRIETEWLDEYGRVYLRYRSTYDQNGYLLETIKSGKKDKVLKKTRYAYEFYEQAKTLENQ